MPKLHNFFIDMEEDKLILKGIQMREIISYIKKLIPNKSSSQVLKEISHMMAFLLFKLFNKSLSED